MSENQDRLQSGLVADQRIVYRDRIKYSEYVDQKSFELGIDFLDTVNKVPLYGFVDRGYHIVEPNPELQTFGDYAADLKGLNYTVACFNNFRDRFLEIASQSDSFSAPQRLEGLIPKKSYLDISEGYLEYQGLVSEAFLETLLVQESARNMQLFQFLDALDMALFSPDRKQYKVTKSGFVLSTYSRVYYTGLYVDLAPQMNPSIDYEKVELLSDPFFKCYGQMANRYGFYIDKNCPWRLVLNLNSPVTRANIQNSNFSRNFYDFYSEEYLMRIGLDDYWNFKSFYKRMYMKYLKEIGQETISRSVLDSVEEERWIKSYVINRLREIGEYKAADYHSSDQAPTPSKIKYNKLLTTAIERYNILGYQNMQQLSSNSGVILYIEEQCADLLRSRIRERTRIDNSNS